MSRDSSPSFQYEDAPPDPPTISDLTESPTHAATAIDLSSDALELQPSPPQTPRGGTQPQSQSLLHDSRIAALVSGSGVAADGPIREDDYDGAGEGSLSVDVSDEATAGGGQGKEEDGLESISTSPTGVPIPIASPANSVPVAVPHLLPTVEQPAAAAAVAVPVASAPPAAAAVAAPALPVPVDPAVAERAARRAAFFKGQAQRSQQLAGQLDMMGKQMEREDVFWSNQEHRFNAMLQRAEMADRTSKELVRFFQVSSRAVSRTLEELSAPVTLGSIETGSLKEACAATEQIRLTLADNLSELRDKHLTHCMAHAGNLSKAMTERAAAATQVVTAASRDVKKEREHLRDAWTAYDKSVQERVKAEFSERAIRSDPLLPLRQLLPTPSTSSVSASTAAASSTSPSAPPPPLSSGAASSAAILHANYRRALSALFLDIRVEEERRIEQSRAFLLQSLMSVNSTLETLHAKVRAGIAAMTAVDAAADLAHFIDDGHLHLAEIEAASLPPAQSAAAAALPVASASPLSPPVASASASTAAVAPVPVAPPTVFDLIPPTRDSALLHRMYELEVEREGLLQRPGRFFKTKWKEQWVAVSKSGWLHCWEERTDAQPVFSMSLADAHAVLDTRAGAAGGIEILSTAGGVFGGGKGREHVGQVFRADTAQEAQRWVDSINRFCYPSAAGG